MRCRLPALKNGSLTLHDSQVYGSMIAEARKRRSAEEATLKLAYIGNAALRQSYKKKCNPKLTEPNKNKTSRNVSNAALKPKSRCNPSVDTKPNLFTFSHKGPHLRNTPIVRGVKKYAFKSIKEPSYTW